MREEDLDDDPIAEFGRWMAAARAAGTRQPEAMALATVDSGGRPTNRMVLLKGADQAGFVWFTNYESRKGRDLSATRRAALTFYWGELGRQVRITGRVSRSSRAASVAYFRSRPRESQIAAAVSRQSYPIATRADLDAAYARFRDELGVRPVPVPGHWGGFRLRPDAIEFWEHRDDRLHDRIRFTRTGEGWRRERLQP